MPFRSLAQQRLCYALEGARKKKISGQRLSRRARSLVKKFEGQTWDCQEWSLKTNYKNLPNIISKRSSSRRSNRRSNRRSKKRNSKRRRV